MRNRLIVIIILLSVFLIEIFPQKKNKITLAENNLTETTDIIFSDSVINRYNIVDRMKFYKIPSVSIAVIENGKIEWSKAYGYTNIRRKKLANTNTLYQVASISKSVNGFAIMKLLESKKLSFDTDIRDYLKTWKFPDNELSKGNVITIKNLLSHTAGLSTRGYIGYSTLEKLPTINQILNGEKPANNEPVVPIFKPNTQYQYSGGGYTIIRKILDDNISGDYDKLMKNLVLNPLKMTNSTFSQPLEKKYKNYALAYDQNEKPLKGDFYVYPDKTAGGLWSTATDIAKFIIAVQNSLQANNSILEKKYADEMLTSVLNNYALGFGIDTRGGEKYFWHEGESYGYRSIYYGSFTTGKGVVILTNSFPENGRPFVIEVLNSIATTYDWQNFYNPRKKKLVKISEKILDSYVGEYYCANPEMKITIAKDNGQLYLTARQSERLYPTSENTFFIKSQPDDECVFLSSKNNGIIDTFEVIQNGKVIIIATKG